MTRCYGDLLLVVLLSVVFGASFADDDLQSQVLERYLEHADSNHDGILELSDYQRIVKRIFTETNYTKYTPDEADKQIAVKAFAAFPMKTVTKAEYMALGKAALGTADGKTAVLALANIKFDFFNSEGPPYDDSINLAELNIAYRVMAISLDNIQTCFDAIDGDRDKKLSRDEYVNGAYNFFTTTNKTDPILHFFGYWIPK